MAPSDKQQPSDQSSELTADRDISDAINAFGKKYETAQEGRPEHDREILKWTKGAGIGVCFYTLLTFALTTLAFCQLQETKHSLVADTRAWVGPYEVSIDAFGPQSKTTNLVLKYKNAGKEPALNFNDSYNDDWTGTVDDSDKLDFTKNCFADDPNGKPSEETCADRINRWLKTNCERKAPYEQRVVYPDFSDTAFKLFTITPDRVSDNKIGFLQGCFIYRSNITGSVDHRSAFCYFEHFVSDNKPHSMRSCPRGNEAN